MTDDQTRKWPDYSKEGLGLYEQETWEVYDPWLAQIRGVFYTREDAELFITALTILHEHESGQGQGEQ